MPQILIVDYDASICSTIRDWFQSKGYNVATANGSDAALAALANLNFDVIIVDIFLLAMAGLKTVRAFREHAPSAPLIAITDFAVSATQIAAPDFLRISIELGADRCLRKPFVPTTLLAVVDDCLKEKARRLEAMSR